MISVALATYDGARFLPEQLDSIAAQTRPPDEIVAVDDGSSDATLTILEASPLPIRLHRNQHRLGVAGNFERAISLCGGDIIALCDQDDVWHPEKLAVIESEIADADLVFSDGLRIPTGGTLWERFRFTRRERRRDLFDVLAAHNVVTGATIAFRSRWRDKLLPFPRHPNLLHDRWIAIVIAALGRTRAIERPLIDYREHEEQQRGTRGPHTWIGAARATTAQTYASQAEELRIVLERLEALQAPVTRKLRDRIEHLDARGSMPKSVARRVPVVARELSRYFRYSNGVWSVAKDLVG